VVTLRSPFTFTNNNQVKVSVWRHREQLMYVRYMQVVSVFRPEDEFLDVIGTKVLKVFLLAVHMWTARRKTFTSIGCTPTPFHPITNTHKVAVYAPAERTEALPLFISTLPICTLWSLLLKDFTPLPLSKSGLKLACNVNIVYGNLKPEDSQDNAQKPQRNCTFMNSASGLLPSTYTGAVFIYMLETIDKSNYCTVLSC
jgi:hypothetical protein